MGDAPDLDRFIALFNAGFFWESHEVLEGAWRVERSEFFHGLILLASAYVHAARRNAHGVRAQLAKAEERLATFRPRHLGLDVDAILERASELRRALDGVGDASHEAWSRLPPPPLLSRASATGRAVRS